MEFTGLYYSEDIVFKETSKFDSAVFNTGTVLYEVIRIIDGTALFLEDHIQRLQDSVALSGFTYNVSVPLIHYLLRNLIHRNNTANGNVRIILHFTREGPPPVVFTFFIPHLYPTAQMYEDGVRTALFKGARIDPNIKKMYPEMIEKVNAFIKSENIYDVLLMDENDTVTEGSRTNVFFIKGDFILTAPADKVLKGVTRDKIFHLCNKLNVKLFEDLIPTKSLDQFDAIFFSGTSPKVLPVNSIGRIKYYKVDNELMRRLMKAYNQMVADYIENN